MRVLLETEDDFLSLIWQEIDATRFLTPHSLPRTVRDVALRLIEDGRSFDALCEAQPHQLDPEAFVSFRDMGPFRWDKVGELVLRFAQPEEAAQSPAGTFYVHDEVHRSLLLALGVLQGTTDFQPITASLIADETTG